MTIHEAIHKIDSLKHNTYSQEDKLQWLSRLDAMVKTHILDTHQGQTAPFTGYGEDTDPNTELLVPEPYAEIYLRWLEAQMDYHNGEYGKYNNAMDMFQAAYRGFENYYNRTHMPKGSKIRYFGESAPASVRYQSANGIAKVTIREVEE